VKKVAIAGHHIDKWFGENETKTYAVRDVNFEAFFGELLFIVGPSGSGKTTLLSILSGILKPDRGQVLVDNADIWQWSQDALAEFRLNRIGFVFQDYHLFPKLTTAENVAIPLILKNKDWDESIASAKEYLDIVGLKNKADLSPSKLSGGEQQRVAIARAMVSKPEILIFDEPTASLDGETGKRIIEFVKNEILSEQTCIIIVTHDNRIYSYADGIMHMEDGKIQRVEKSYAQ
jgi:putative ABC transport system ATP-binding protein